MGLLTPDQVRRSHVQWRAPTTSPWTPEELQRETGDPQREESAVQALITGARNAKERQRKPGPRQTVAAFEVPREALHLPESRRAARQDIPGSPSGRTLRGAESEVELHQSNLNGSNLNEAIGNRDANLIRSYRRVNLGIARAHEAANRDADARGWDPVAVDGMLQEVEESTATLLPAAEQTLQELEEEARASWEERAIYHATQVTNLAGEAFKTLSENRWSRRDCTEYQDELDWVMRTFRRVCEELDLSSMPAKMLRAARARQERVNHKYQRATRVVERLLRAHGGQPETRHPPAGNGRRDERKYRDEHVPKERMEYEDSVPMDRQPTLPVANVLGADRQERSWESAPGTRWFQPAIIDRSRGIDVLGMAGLHIGAPAHLQRGGRTLQPDGASTPLGGGPGELPRTYSGSSVRVPTAAQVEYAGQ
jgi:hypothetical protein